MARLLADENFPYPVVKALRQIGHDVVTLADVGRAGEGLTDEAILALAMADNRVVVTLNRKHFIRLHDRAPQHAGIVVCTLDLDFVGQAGRINTTLANASTLTGASLNGSLLRVNRPAAP